MWFKQFQLFQLTQPIQSSAKAFADKLEPLAFNPCLPTMASSSGWVSPIDEEGAPLARGINGCIMFCLQIEEKILPASVVAQTLKEKIHQIELNEARKVRAKEKLAFKDDVIHTLLPRAFTKLTRIAGYIDTRNNWLLVNNTSVTKVDLFVSMVKKSFGDGFATIEVVKPGSIITSWLKNKDYPQAFSIEKSCVLQDPNQQNRVIRCQHQDLFATSIQDLVKDGCEVIQMALCWHDKINFVLADDFSFRGVRYAEDDLVEIHDQMESKQEKFDADFIMMIESYAGLLNDVLNIFEKNRHAQQPKKLPLAS